MVTWLVLGVSTPLVLHFAREGVQTQQSTVVAAPRDNHKLDHPVALQHQAGVVVRSGVVGLDNLDAEGLTEAQRTSKIADGSAQLVLSFGEVGLFDVLSGSIAQQRHETSTADRLNPQAETAIHDLQSAVGAAHFRALRLRHSDFIIELPSQSRLSLRSKDLVFRPLSNGGFAVSGEATWGGQEVAIVITAGAMRNDPAAKDLLFVPVNMSFSSAIFDMAFEGRLIAGSDSGLQGRMTLRTKKLTEMAQAFGLVVVGLGGVNGLELTADTTWNDSGLAFRDARLSLGGQSARGALLINTTEKRPKLSGTLDFNALDLAPFVVAPDAQQTQIRDFLNYVWRVLQNSGSTQLDMDLRVSADNMRVGEFGFGRSAASLFLSQGILKADVTELTVARGTGRAQVSVDLNALHPSVTIRGKIEKAELSEMALVFLKDPAVAGKGNVLIDLTAYGTARETFFRSLEGFIEVALPDGGSVKADLTKLEDKNVPPAEAGSSDVASVAIGSSITPVEFFKMRVAVSEGQAFCERFALATKDLSIEGTAQVDLRDKTLTGHAVLRSSKKLEGIGDSAIVLTGTVDAPVLKRSEIASDFEKEVFGNRVQTGGSGRQPLSSGSTAGSD